MRTDCPPRIVVREDAPFPHFVVSGLLEPAAAEALRRWLRDEAPWRYRRETFYTQQEVNLTALAPPLDALAPAAVEALRNDCERLFGTRLAARVKVCAHRLLSGYEIGIHNDDPSPGQETHRLILQLTSPEDGIDGGELALFGSPRKEDEVTRFPPAFNQAIGFALSGNSFHAVRRVAAGERLTVIYSFWDARAAAEEEPASIDGTVLKAMLRLLAALGADRIPHSGGTLMDHLLGTFHVLDGWGVPGPVAVAGLFHSVYGPPGVPEALIGPAERPALAELIGEEAEMLVHLFCTGPRACFFDAAAGRRGNVPASIAGLPERTLRHLLVLDLANRVELARREPEMAGLTPGEARRLHALPPDALPPDARDWAALLSGGTEG